MQVPIVKVVNEAADGGWMLINESDFDAAVHKLWTDKPAPKVADDKPAAKAKG